MPVLASEINVRSPSFRANETAMRVLVEALKAALQKLSTNETSVSIIHAGVGDVTDSDVLMAGTSAALLVSYNVGVLPNARTTLAQSKIEFIDKKVIYHILERIE